MAARVTVTIFILYLLRFLLEPILWFPLILWEVFFLLIWLLFFPSKWSWTEFQEINRIHLKVNNYPTIRRTKICRLSIFRILKCFINSNGYFAIQTCLALQYYYYANLMKVAISCSWAIQAWIKAVWSISAVWNGEKSENHAFTSLMFVKCGQDPVSIRWKSSRRGRFATKVSFSSLFFYFSSYFYPILGRKILLKIDSLAVSKEILSKMSISCSAASSAPKLHLLIVVFFFLQPKNGNLHLNCVNLHKFYCTFAFHEWPTTRMTACSIDDNDRLSF